MTVRRPGWHELLFGGLLIAGVVAVGLPPTSGPRVPPQVAVPVALAVGAVLFAFLAGGRHAGSIRSLRHGGLLRTSSVVVVVRAAIEEVAWRGFLLGALAAPLSPWPALLVTSVAFSLAHANVHGRRRLVHVATGGTFGAVYLATGQLVAAIAAHASYNTFIVLAASGAGTRDAT